MEDVRPCLPTDQSFIPTDDQFVSPSPIRDENRAHYKSELYQEERRSAHDSHQGAGHHREPVDQVTRPQALTRKRRTVTRSTDMMRAGELLSELGVPREMVTRSMTLAPRYGAWGYYHNRARNLRRLGRNPRSSFWHRPTNELYDLLEAARTSFREKIKRAHPDKSSESHHEAARLNMLWRKAKVLFRRHGIEFVSVTPSRQAS
jgi:hypothetical protein